VGCPHVKPLGQHLAAAQLAPHVTVTTTWRFLPERSTKFPLRMSEACNTWPGSSTLMPFKYMPPLVMSRRASPGGGAGGGVAQSAHGRAQRCAGTHTQTADQGAPRPINQSKHEVGCARDVLTPLEATSLQATATSTTVQLTTLSVGRLARGTPPCPMIASTSAADRRTDPEPPALPPPRNITSDAWGQQGRPQGQGW
jgi:hypothetical protein